MALAQLADWANFYVITGSAAAGLTGLTFVVIAITSEAMKLNPVGLSTFITPTIVHFGTVLALAAFMCVPHQTALSLSVGLAAIGICGIAYTATITANVHHNLALYVPVWEDWLWNSVLPFLSYGALCAAGYFAARHLDGALCATGAASMMLLFIGIHNAWDIAVWISLRRQDAEKANQKGGESTPGTSERPGAPS